MRIPVAVMAKVPAAGEVKTRLCPPLTPIQAAGLAQCFLQDRVAQLAGIPTVTPVVAFAPPERQTELAALLPGSVRLVPQQGPDLGARLDRLLTDLIAEGSAGAIAVDADSPTLPTDLLRRACAHLADPSTDVVLGPSEDGGYYLVGMRAPHPALFEHMPWSTPTVLGRTLERAQRQGLRVACLSTWFDVDTGADLERLRVDLEASPATWPRLTRAFLERRIVRAAAADGGGTAASHRR